MAAQHVRVITLLKRKDGMSLDDFIAYYETHHRVIGDKYLKPFAVGYRRKFLRPMDSPASTTADDTPYDVVMEIDFPDVETMQAAFATLVEPDAQAEIVADEEKLFDRSKTRSFIEDLRTSF